MLWLVGAATDALGGNRAGCDTDHFIVWKVPPRRAQMLCAKFSRARFGGARRAVATFLLLRHIDGEYRRAREESNLRRPCSPILVADPRTRRVGITPTRRRFSSNKTQTTTTMRSFRLPSSTTNHEHVEVRL